MADDKPQLKFNNALEADEDAPVYDQAEADLEVATGQEVKKAKTTDLELRPVEELTDEERRLRAKLLAVKKYAPWMKDIVSDEAIAQREAAERDRKTKKSEKLVGNRIDPAKQELAGSGLKAKVSTTDVGGDVELSWFTGTEDDNAGFIVARKAASEGDFTAIASYEKFQSLRSKGPSGGSYRFVDENVPAGTYLYKVQDVTASSKFVTDVCQRAVDVVTTKEQSATLAVLAGFGVVVGLLGAVGVLLDPQ